MPENIFRILAIDDHPIVLEGIQSIANRLPNTSCMVKNSLQALAEMNKKERFDLCILDLGICGQEHGKAIRQLRACQPKCRILIYTMHEEPWIADELTEWAIEGAVSKNSSLSELCKAIESIRQGQPYYDPVFTRIMQPDSLQALTIQETQVLKHITDGLTNKQIADKMSISVNTVKTHRKKLMKKFKASSVAQLINAALKQK